MAKSTKSRRRSATPPATWVVLYFRMSSDQQEDSIPTQRKGVAKYIKDHGLKAVGEYADHGVSGWKQRDEFDRMIEDIRNGKVRAARILAWDLDRFSREEPHVVISHCSQLLQQGTMLVDVKKDKTYDVREMGDLMQIAFDANTNSTEPKKLSDRTTGPRAAKVENGAHFGRRPLGYDKGDDHRLVPGDKGEIERVRFIFEQTAKGVGANSIAKRLNENGTKTTRGNRWSPNAVRGVLSRAELYLGHLVVGKTQRGKYNHMFAEQKVIRNTHEPLITKTLATKAKDARAKRQFQKRGGKATAITGICFCGDCGGKMDLTRRYDELTCRNHAGKNHAGKKCSSSGRNAVPYQAVAEEIIRRIADEIYSDGIEDRLRKAIADQAKKAKGKVRTVADVEKDIDAAEKAIEAATDRMIDVESERAAKRFRIRIDELEDKIDSLELERLELAASSDVLDASAVLDERRKVADDLRLAIKHGEEEAINQILRDLGVRVVLEFEEREDAVQRKRKKTQWKRAVISFQEQGTTTTTNSLFQTICFKASDVGYDASRRRKRKAG